MYFVCTHPSCDRDRRVRLDGMDADKGDDDVPSFVGGTGAEGWRGIPKERVQCLLKRDMPTQPPSKKKEWLSEVLLFREVGMVGGGIWKREA